MDGLYKQVRRVRRRLAVQRLLAALAWCWFAALLAALGAVVADKWRTFGLPAGVWVVGALGAGLLAALAWTWLTRRSLLEAAIELDLRFRLKERVSSALALRPEQHDTPFGQALVCDAQRRVNRLDIAERFPVRAPLGLLLPVVPALATLLVVVFVNPVAENSRAESDPAAVSKAVEQSAAVLRRKLAERRKAAEKLGLKDAERLFQKLEAGSEELAARVPDRKQALVELKDLNRQLAQRREQLGGVERLKEQLDQLRKLEGGPAERLAAALKRGDFRKAAQQLAKLKAQLEQGDLDANQKQQLAAQLDELQQQLGRLAHTQQAKREDLQQQIDQLRQAGQSDQADRLQQQLDKLLAEAPEIAQLKQFAEQLNLCRQALCEGQLSDAIGQLGQLQAQLEELQNQLAELEMLDQARAELAQAHRQMLCPECGGAGCPACLGLPGMGLGEGQGQGPRPEAEDQTAFHDSQVRQRVGQGVAEAVGFAPGPNVRGQSQEAVQVEFDAVRSGRKDPLGERHIPRNLRDHAQEYFDRLRQGE